MTDDRDERMDEMLILGARDYNEPGPVPREAMWARIAEARAAAAIGRVPAAGGRLDAANRPLPTSRHRLWFWPGLGVAAAAVLVLGVAIGRQIERRSAALPAAASSVAARQPTVAPKPAPATAPALSEDSVVAVIRSETQKTDQRVRELAKAQERPSATSPASPAERVADNESSALAYRLVVLQHLAGSEAMITAFRTSARRGEVDAQLASWSRELLTTTRMLEASPVASDPTMKRLLDDLDLVIGQIVMYATRGTNNPEELDLIEQSITSRGVITKLRSTIPARTLSGS